MTPTTAPEEPSVEQAQEPAEPSGPTARAPRRRRKATAAQATPENVPAPEGPSAPELPAEPEAGASAGDDAEAQTVSQSAQEQAPGTAPARRRRRATAAQAAPEVVVAAETEVSEAAETPEDVAAEAVSTADADQPEGEVSPEPQDVTEEDSDEDAEVQDEVPALPAASLLFQVPDSSQARRRRRVTAGTGAPTVAPAAGQPLFMAQSDDEQPQEVKGDAGRSRSGRRSSPPAKDAESSGSEGTSRQGRRRRKATAGTGAPEHVEEPVQAPTEAEDGAQGAESPEDASTGTEGAKRGSGRRRRKARGSRASEDERREEGPEDQDDTQEPEDPDAVEDRDEDEDDAQGGRRKRRRGGRGRRSRARGEDGAQDGSEEEPSDSEPDEDDSEDSEDAGSSRRRRRRRSRTRSDSGSSRDVRDEVTALKGSTRLEAKRQRRREGRAAGRRRPIVSEAEFLARRESVDRQMIVREQDGLNQIAVIEDGLLVEHYVARHTQTSMVGNVYVGRVQNVLPSMEAAFIDLGKGRNAVLYAGEVNWDAAGTEGGPRRIEAALKSGDAVLVQVTKDPIGHKGARLTSQVTLAGRYLVLVPGSSMTGISRKLPDTERSRLKKILKRVVPEGAGVIVRTAAEGASEEQLGADVERLVTQWQAIDKKSKQVLSGSGKAPVLLKGEPELAVRVVRDVFNEDFRKLIVQGDSAWKTINEYVTTLSPDLEERLEHWVSPEDVFAVHRVDEQLSKGFDRKVWLPSGGTLVIDRTEAMTVVDVNTGRFTGAGGTLEETVTRNNIEAAEEIVRQLRLRDIGGMVVIDFVDMVLESNRDLVLRRLVECLGRDRTRHQVTEVTSLGLVQMTRKRVGQGLVEAFSTPCECCGGRGFIVHDTPVENQQADLSVSASRASGRARGRKGREEGSSERSGGTRKDKDVSSSSGGAEAEGSAPVVPDPEQDKAREVVRRSLAQIAAAAEHAHAEQEPAGEASVEIPSEGSEGVPAKGPQGADDAGAESKE